MTNNLRIRNAKSKDRNAVFVMAKTMATSFVVEEESFNESFSEVLEDESAICLVAETDKGICGYLLGFDHKTFYANGRVSCVEEVYVKEDLRRTGIGKVLMERFAAWGSERDSILVYLATRRASDFYEGIDYEESALCFRKLLK